MTTTETVDAFLRAHAGDEGIALRFEDESWTWPEATAAAAQRAALLLSTRKAGPLHVGVLADNVPEYVHWLSAAALAPTSASAFPKYGPAIGLGIGMGVGLGIGAAMAGAPAPVYATGCYQDRVVATPFGPRIRVVNVCRYY